MLPFGVTIPATVPQGSEIPEGLTNYPVFYSQCCQERVSAAVDAILRVMLLLQEHECTNVVSCAVTA
jgi:hypothetical protein